MEKLPRVLFTAERFVKRMRPEILKRIIPKAAHIVLTDMKPLESDNSIPFKTVQ